MKFGNIFVGKGLFVGCGKPKALGKEETVLVKKKLKFPIMLEIETIVFQW